MSDVDVTVTYRQTQTTHKLKFFAEQRVKRIGSYFFRPLKAHVIPSVDANIIQLAKNQLYARGEINRGNNQHDDLQAAIGLDVAKAERQAKRQKQSNELNRRRPIE